LNLAYHHPHQIDDRGEQKLLSYCHSACSASIQLAFARRACSRRHESSR
jgi:hypothetical protein